VKNAALEMKVRSILLTYFGVNALKINIDVVDASSACAASSTAPRSPSGDPEDPFDRGRQRGRRPSRLRSTNPLRRGGTPSPPRRSRPEEEAEERKRHALDTLRDPPRPLALGMITATSMGGLIHVLLVIAVVSC